MANRLSPSGNRLFPSGASFQMGRNFNDTDAGSTIPLFDNISNATSVMASKAGFVRTASFNAFPLTAGTWTAGNLIGQIEIDAVIVATLAPINAPGGLGSIDWGEGFRFSAGSILRVLGVVSSPFTETSNVRLAVQLNLTYDG